MQRIVTGLIAVALLATAFIAGSVWRANQTVSPDTTKRSEQQRTRQPIEAQTPAKKISAVEASDHRERHYESLTRIADVFELPTGFSQYEAMFAIAGRANAAEIEDLILQTIRLANRHKRGSTIDLLFSRYTELDPHAAVAFLVGIDLDTEDRALNTIFSHWAQSDLPSAISAANQLQNAVRRKKAGYAVLDAASRHSLGDLKTIASQLADNHNINILESDAIGLRANHDPQSALYEAIGVSSAQARSRAIYRVGRVWARQDPAAAMAAVDGIANRSVRASFMNAVYSQWMNDDPDSAIASLLAISDSRVREQQIQNLMYSFSDTDPVKSLELASHMKGQGREQAYSTIFQNWLEQDIDGAMQAFSELDESIVNSNSVTLTIGRQLAAADPDRALAWIETLDAHKKEIARSFVFSQFAETDPLRAINMALELQPSEHRERILSGIISQFASSDPQLALQYLDKLPAGQQREHLYQSIASQWAAKDIQAAIGWASTLSGTARVQAMSGMARQIAGNDPQQAANIVRQLPAASRGQVLRNISSTLASNDPQEALDWLQQFSEDPAYDEAVVKALQHGSYINPRRALDIASELRSEHRVQAIQTALHRWSRMDPAAAASWAANSNTNVRSTAVSAVATSWGHSDPLAAQQWAQSLRGDAKDNALASLVGNSAFSATDVNRMISSIKSEQVRSQAISTVFYQLHQIRKDPQAATDFLDRIGASDELRQRLLSGS